MNIRWDIVDEILRITGSHDQQLLDWLSDPDVMDCVFPCSCGELYLGMYSFLEADIYDESVTLGDAYGDDEMEVLVPDIAEEVGIYEFWDEWRSDDRFRANMRRNFKRRYSL